MAGNRGTSPATDSEAFWNYVPDPSRTVLFLLLAVAAFAAAEWIPDFAARIEQTRIQERRRETRERQLAEYEQWRREYPQYVEILAQERRRAELEAEYQLAQPNPMPMPMATEESATPALWN